MNKPEQPTGEQLFVYVSAYPSPADGAEHHVATELEVAADELREKLAEG